MKRFILVIFVACLALPASAQWTYYNRAGSYAHSELRCNLPSLITDAGGVRTLAVKKQDAVCGDTDSSGAVIHAPTTFNYSSSGMQFTSASFLYGTITIDGEIPTYATQTWPAFWLLAATCQQAFIHSNDAPLTPVAPCPKYSTTGYAEFDFVECTPWSGVWCTVNIWANTGNGPICDTATISPGRHTFVTQWFPAEAGGYKLWIDGVDTLCSGTTNIPDVAMFLIIETQVTSAVSDAHLPTAIKLYSVDIKAQDGSTLFHDDFAHRLFPMPGAVSR